MRPRPTSEDAGLVGMAVMGVAASPLGTAPTPPPQERARRPGATFYPKPGRQRLPQASWAKGRAQCQGSPRRP